jgi:CheY-specific phosphatase CheX
MLTLSEQAEAFGRFQDYLVKGALNLFRTYGLPVEHSMGSAAVHLDGPSVMAVIGYAAPTVRGALLLLTSRKVVTDLRPAELRTQPVTEAILKDILGEFCNMLIGRIKNRLSTHEVNPLVSTPTTVFGDDLTLPVPTSGMSAWHEFASGAGEIYIRLDATFESAFALGPSDPAAGAPLAEGEMVVFEDG